MVDTSTEKKAAPAKPRTSSRPTVSARPAAVGAVNGTVIGGASIVQAVATGLIAAPMAGLAAVALAGAAAGGVAASRRLQSRRSGSPGSGRSSGARSGGLGLGRSGRSSAATPGRSGGQRAGMARSSGLGGSRSGTGSSKRGSGGAGLFSGLRGRGSGGGSGRPGAGGATAGKGPKGSGGGNGLTAAKVARARKKIAKRRKPGVRLSEAIRSATAPTGSGQRPTARDAWRTARTAVTGGKPKKRGTIRRAGAGLAAAGIAAGKVAWQNRKARRAAKRAAGAAGQATKPGQRRGKTPRVGTAVRGRTDPAKKPRTPAPPPATQTTNKRRLGRRPAAAPTGGTSMANSSAVAQMIDLAEEMVRVASTFERPEGNMELLDSEYARLGDLQRTVAQAWKVMHDRATDPHEGDGLPQPIMDLLDELHTHQLRNADTADEVAPLARRLEQARIDALADRRNRRWDHRANPDHAA